MLGGQELGMREGGRERPEQVGPRALSQFQDDAEGIHGHAPAEELLVE